MSTQEYKKEWAQALWKEVFNDSEPFMHLYFGNVYRDDNNVLLGDYAAGKALAQAQYLQYKWIVPSFQNGDKQRPEQQNRTVTCGYISGLCTAPERRGMGLASFVMHSAHQHMHNRGDMFSFLLPATPELYTFYSTHFDYVPIRSRLALPVISAEQIGRQARSELTLFQEKALRGALPTDLFMRFNRTQRAWAQRYQTPLHSLCQWQTVCTDLALSGGGIVCKDHYDLYLQPCDSAHFKLRFLVPHQLSSGLINEQIGCYLQELTGVSTQPIAHEPYGMLCITDLQAFLNRWGNELNLPRSFIYTTRGTKQRSGRAIQINKNEWQLLTPGSTYTAPARSYSLQALTNLFVTRYPALIYLLLE